jgi:hypothetical protein
VFAQDKDLPTGLKIGDSASLFETMPVAAFGFPFGKDLAEGKSDFPTVTVNTGRISALRKVEGKLDTIQMEGALNPGSSGGPVVNEKGEVVGVVRSGITGSGISMAVPANLIRQFLYGPGVILRASPLQFAPGATTRFEAEVSSGSQDAGELSVTLTLSNSPRDVRELKASKSPGETVYSASAVLVPSLDPNMLEANIEDQGDQWSIPVKDRAVQVAGRSIMLSDIEVLTQGSAPVIELKSGKKLAGTPSGMSALECLRNGKPGTIDLSRVQVIRFNKPAAGAAKSVAYEVVVRRGAALIARQKGVITAEGILPDIDRTPENSSNGPGAASSDDAGT